MGFIIRIALIALGGLLACLKSLAPTHTVSPSPQNYILEGNAHYYEGRPREALDAYSKALALDGDNLNARRSGAVVLNELGNAEAAVIWYREAARLSPHDHAVLTALAETELTLGHLISARTRLKKILKEAPKDLQALTAFGRVELAANDPAAAARPLKSATDLAPNFTLAHFYLGRALERLDDRSGALEAYKLATFKDSYFTSARYHMSRTLAGLRRFHEAYDQATRLVATAPVHRGYRKLKRALRRRIKGRKRPASQHAEKKSKKTASRRPMPVSPPPAGKIPKLRVGIGTNGMGKQLGWGSFHFAVRTPFEIVSARSGSILARGPAGSTWKVFLTKKGNIIVRSGSGKKILKTKAAIRIRPNTRKGGWTYFKELPGKRTGSNRLARTLRGEIEISRHPRKNAFKIVNVIDLESYTQGVLTAEMPIRSPMEALKAQAVIARTHALFVKDVRPRHKYDGYQLCDGQHCQVYFGVGSETSKSRTVVEDTKGRVVTHRGRVAEILYSSNCGGHSQSSGDLRGWTLVPYFTGVSDGNGTDPIPSSPWELRQWLKGSPKSYCSPSAYVYSSHYRWSRVVPAKDLERRLHRTLKIGRLKHLLPLKRSVSGHLNSIQVTGTKGVKVVDTEMRIRGLFGIGSQRSTLFVMDTEYDSKGRPKNFIFSGGGWGHGVGMCQSGAMGRAEAGQSYAKILKSYYKGIEVGNLRY